MYSQEIKESIKRDRMAGLSSRELALKYMVPRSTISIWISDIKVSKQGQDRIADRVKQNQNNFKRYAKHTRSQHYYDKWNISFNKGLNSFLTREDALAIGLYLGEGSKTSTRHNVSWSFTNSDRELIQVMIQWAVRTGQTKNGFRAKIQIHPEDTYSETEIRAFWAKAGINPDRIKIYKIRSNSSKKKTTRKTPFGTCNVAPIGGAVSLYAYYKGQCKALLG